MKYSDEILRDKSIAFAIRIVKLSKVLRNARNETVLAKQILRSGTSIGANISESEYAQSKADFITKLHIALKEAAETKFWIEILSNTDYLSESEQESLMKDCLELIRLLAASINTTKNNHKKD